VVPTSSGTVEDDGAPCWPWHVGHSSFVYVTGCDGTGKTTQTQLLLMHYRKQGIKPRHLWMRFPFFLTLPLLAYARLRGFSWYETCGGNRQGYWDFRRSWLLRTVLPWVLLIDTAIAALFRVHLPLRRGQTIVCERFVFDILVDLSLAFDDPDLHRKLPGRLYLRLVPCNARCVILYLDPDTLRARRSDLEIDKRLEARLAGFQRLAQDLGLTMLSSHMSIESINQEIIERCTS
jgi:hypothetical protein